MATKNITITEDAYEHLRAHKRNDESFSDVVLRLTEQADPMEFAGSCPGLAQAVQDARNELNEDLEAKNDELFG